MNNRNPLEYRSWAGRSKDSGRTEAIVAFCFSSIAAVVEGVSVVGCARVQNFGIGLIFGVGMLVGWIIALIGMVIAVVALCKTNGERGKYALGLGVAAIGLSIVFGLLFPGPGLGNIH